MSDDVWTTDFPWLDRDSFGGITPRLPPEIFEAVVVAARNNHQFATLATLAQCSKATHALVVPHLYRSVTITPSNVLGILYGLVGPDIEPEPPVSAAHRMNPLCQYKMACLALVHTAEVVGEEVSGCISHWEMLVYGEDPFATDDLLFPNVTALRLTNTALCPFNRMLTTCFNPRSVCVTVTDVGENSMCTALYNNFEGRGAHIKCVAWTESAKGFPWSLDTLSIHGAPYGDLIYPFQSTESVPVRIFQPVEPRHPTLASVPSTFEAIYQNVTPFGMSLPNSYGLLAPAKAYEVVSVPGGQDDMVKYLENNWDRHMGYCIFNSYPTPPPNSETLDLAYILSKVTWTDVQDASPCQVCGEK